ncbi:hypothetical protein IFR04_007894 [Cadophora malorum]|uniref:Uncharacterized protein n=1 Tax=Cadophora malorum TaxID=108018 RepID=A0A8H7W878_9HELO|nr:hypothetical protein IFR04_007894 [Cadophora malorum]
MSFLGQIMGNVAPLLAAVVAFYRPMDAAVVASGLLIGGGVFAILSPIELGLHYGIPFADANNTLFVPGLGGRNAAIGIATLVLRYLDERRSMGILLGVYTLAGFSDIGLLLSTPGSENLGEHVRNVSILLIISFRLLRG